MNAFIRTCILSAAVAVCPLSLYAQPSMVAVTDAILRRPPAGDWLMWRRTYDAHGHSALAEVDTQNVQWLTMRWSRSLGAGRNEMTPIVHNGVMYIPHPHDIIESVDAATGVPHWIYRRERPADLTSFSPFPDLKRNIAIYDHLIISTSADQFVYALDAAFGSLVWETRVRDYRGGGNQGSGPLIVNGLAISGRNCAPRSGAEACVITAHDAKTGAEIWRTRTIPRAGEPGDETWGGVPEERRRHVSAWMVPSYDPDLNLLYIGTSVTVPEPKFLLAGYHNQYLYHNSTLALDPRTGRIAWYYQHLVDEWDLDHTFERLLVNTRVAPNPAHVLWRNPRIVPGEVRQVLTGVPGKTGIIYTLDRRTGEFLWATPMIEQNIVSSIEGGTGRVITNREVVFDSAGDEVRICPSLRGGRQWEPGAYSPIGNTMFFPLMNTCGVLGARGDTLRALRLGEVTVPDGKTLGVIKAVSVASGRVLWQHDLKHAPGALLATAGGLLFGGDHSGYFRALDQRTGEVLWEINLGAPVVGPPIAFSAGGEQYVAVSTGAKLQTPILLFLADRNPRWADRYLSAHPPGNTLYVFGLPRN